MARSRSFQFLSNQRSLNFEVKPERLLSPDEIYDQADDELLRKMAEDRRIERKPGSYSGSDLGEYIGMWAN